MQWSADGCIAIDYFNYISGFIVLMIYLIIESLAFIIMWPDLAKETFSIVLPGLIVMYY